MTEKERIAGELENILLAGKEGDEVAAIKMMLQHLYNFLNARELGEFLEHIKIEYDIV